MTTEDTCSDCGRPKKAYADGCCAAELTGYDDECTPLTIAKLRSELATRRTWKVDEATAAELARLKRELASARANSLRDYELGQQWGNSESVKLIEQLRAELAEESAMRKLAIGSAERLGAELSKLRVDYESVVTALQNSTLIYERKLAELASARELGEAELLSACARMLAKCPLYEASGEEIDEYTLTERLALRAKQGGE